MFGDDALAWCFDRHLSEQDRSVANTWVLETVNSFFSSDSSTESYRKKSLVRIHNLDH